MSLVQKTSTPLALRRFQTEADRISFVPKSRSMSMAVWLMVGAVVFVVLATLTVPVDKIVASNAGKIVTLQPLTILQSLDPSIIKSLNVKEGETVAKGQVLATLDEALTTADLSQMTSQVAGLKAEGARLDAELAKQPFNPPLNPSDGAFSYMALQKQIYDKRAAQFAADLANFDEKIKLLNVTITKLQADVTSYQQRDKIAQQIEGMKDSLFKSGSSSLLNLLSKTDARVEMQRTMQFDINTLAESRHQISSLQADRESYIQKWFSDANTALVTSRNNLDQAQAALEKAAKHQDLVSVIANEPSIVLSIPKVSAGSVLKQGDPVMTLMPLSTPIQVEASIASSNIGFVKVGDKARLKFDAFTSSEHGYADGKVIWISADAFTTNDSGQAVDAFYKVRISVDAYHFVGVPENFRLIPGMTLEADINVGTRLLGVYLFNGAVKGASESMREP